MKLLDLQEDYAQDRKRFAERSVVPALPINYYKRMIKVVAKDLILKLDKSNDDKENLKALLNGVKNYIEDVIVELK